MSLRTLPEAGRLERPRNYQWDVPSEVLARWTARPLAADEDQANTVTIFDVIGEDFWSGGGFTAKRAAAALRSIGGNPVTVQINSPGGDLFEGLAIYNLLRKHPAKVTVEVMGWAASAASIIAMAGDDIRMGLGTFMMVHNAWGLVIGNRHDMREGAELFDGFDSAIADIYEARTGAKRSEIERLMDAESFMGPTEAIRHGFADALDEGLAAADASARNMDPGLMARRQIEADLAKAGVPRAMREQRIKALLGERDAARPAARDAGDVTAADLMRLVSTLNS